VAEAHATIDFETKSQAGYHWNETAGKWEGPPGAAQGKKGLSVVGVVAYAQHPTTDVLTISWALPDGRTGRWRPGVPLYHLEPLFAWIAAGGTVEAHNLAFEFWIWWCVCVPRYGFPAFPLAQGACSMATARVNQFPGGLGQLGTVLKLPIQKDKEGTRLLNKFSVPRKPTKNDPRFWITPDDDPVDGEKLYSYCDTDVAAERWASASMPPMTPAEREFWLEDQAINLRGIHIDRKGVRDCIAVLNEALDQYGQEFGVITGGIKITEIAQFKGWLAAQGVYTTSLDTEHIELLLKQELAPHVRRTLEIRDLIGSASVKKLFSMENMASAADRLHNLIVHHGTRTGRPTGEGPQPLNLPKAGPKLATCGGCGQVFHPKHMSCPWCGVVRPPPDVERERRISPTWRPSMVPHVLAVMATRSLKVVEHYLGDAVLCIMGCVRGLFDAEEGYDLVASDYSAIEAVVTAMLAGEEWRIASFRAKEDIYISSASKITGNPVSFYDDYLALHGEKHPDRQYIGKVAELALGFGGWIGAWRQFDDSDKFTDDEVKKLILAWRDASPAIVELWGGQSRGGWHDKYPCLFGFEGAAIAAVQNPGTTYTVSGIEFFLRGDALIVKLLSGRELTYHELTYHKPRLSPGTRDNDPAWQL
jgi:DNA polymerase